MDAYTVSLVLMLVGLILIALEPVIPGFFVSVVGVFFLVMGIVGYVNPDYLYSPVAVSVGLLLAAGAGIVVLYTYKNLAGNQEPQLMVASSLVGKKGIVRKKVIPNSLDGKVEIDSSLWSAKADHEIPEGTMVEVIHSEGVHVVVKEVEEKR